MQQNFDVSKEKHKTKNVDIDKVPFIRFFGFNKKWEVKRLNEISEPVKNKNKDNSIDVVFSILQKVE